MKKYFFIFICLPIFSLAQTDLFKEIVKKKKFDINNDDFYDDDENHLDGSSPCQQVCDKIYNQLLSEPELLAPDWY